MRLTYPQYNYYESIYHITGKHFAHHQQKNSAMRMTVATSSTMTPRVHRKGFRTPSKRHPGKVLPGKLHSISRVGPGKIAPGKRINPRPHPPPCDNSNDSGFGFDQHVEIQNNNNQQQQHQQQIVRTIPTSSRCVPLDVDDDDDDTNDNDDDVRINNDDDINNVIRIKRRKIENIQIDNDDACSNDAFIQKIATTTATASTISSSAAAAASSYNTTCTTTKFLSTSGRGNVRAALKRPALPIQSSITTSSKDGSVQLQIISQPEQQHRARYQTEGSRGAVKDRSGNGFPIVKLIGYNKPAVLQVFIGTDIGRVAPHMFYQACKVAGKNSTPCTEKKVDGTMIIEIEFKPENDMLITCDCVGILKERNVDVEHRFPDHSGQRSKKKSTRCRMVFRTQLTHDDGSLETLQVCSYPIICTQPPGVPEICKKSLTSCPVDGGLELFIIGKNFLKDTCVVFRDGSDGALPLSQNDIARLQNPLWEQTVFPDKEYLQQTHLVCTVPPYIQQNIVESVTVHFFVMSSGKRSESHTFIYTPKGTHNILSAATTLSTLHSTLSSQQDAHFTDANPAAAAAVLWGSNVIEPKHELDSGMMPPPATLPLGVGRRPSLSNAAALMSAATNGAAGDQISQGLKTEIMDENSQSSAPDTMQTDSLDQFSSAASSNDTAAAAVAAAAVAAAAAATTPIQRIRKQSIDIMDMHSTMSSLLNEANSMSNFPTSRNVVDFPSIKQEELNSQILSVAVAQAAQAAQAAQDQQVNKFLSSLDSNMSELKPSIDSTASAVNSLFVNAPTSNNSNGIFSQQTSLSNMNLMPATTPSNLERTFSQSILSNGSPTSNMNPILTLSPNDSPKTVRSPSSNSSSSASIHSPLTQDIILNSEPAASIQSANIQMMPNQGTNTSPAEHITSELILNTTVSPSMMCPTASSDPNSLIVNQVTMANTILNEMNLAAAASQNTQDSLLNNMMINSHPPSDQMNSSHKAASTVSNMMLKAAADFITNQERGSISTESTLNALMSLNSTPILNDSQSAAVAAAAVSQMLNSQNNVISSSVLTRNEPQSPQSRLENIIQHAQQQQQQQQQQQSAQSTLSRHLTHFNEQDVMSGNHPLTTVTNVNGNSLSSAVSLGSLLMNQDVSRTATQNEYLHNLQKTSAVLSSGNQESLLQAVSSLTQNGLDKTKIDGTVEQIAVMSQTTSLNQNNSTQSTTTTTIPQEITTMSDQDLISYINPSCFDQV